MASQFIKTPEELVNCWTDDDRMDFLFSAFPADAQSKPEHWTAKMKFWTSLIINLFYSSSAISVSKTNVLTVVTRNGKSPLGFDTVWQEMLTKGMIVPSTEYLKNLNMNSTWFGWSVNTLVRKPSQWLAEKLLSPVKNKNFDVNYICCESLVKKTEDVIKTMLECDETYKLSGDYSAISYQSLARVVSSIVENKECLDIILLTLEKEKRISVYVIEQTCGLEIQTTKHIKFSKVCANNVNHFTDIDQGVAHLQHTKSSLLEEISVLCLKQKNIYKMARIYVQKNQKLLAKRALAQKQLITKNIDEKEKHVSKVDQMLNSIEQSQLDSVMFNSYKIGLSAYKSFVEKSGLNVKNVADTMHEVAEMTEDADEISSVLGDPLWNNSNQEELEVELQNILKENNEDKLNVLAAELSNLDVEDRLPDTHPLSKIEHKDSVSKLLAT